MLKSSLCDYSGAYILVKGRITVNNTGIAAAPNNRTKKVIFKNCAPFTNCISEINNTQKDNVKDIDIVIEYSDNYSIISGSLWQYCKDIPAVNDNNNVVSFNKAKDTESFNFKAKVASKTNNAGEINNAEIMIPLKCLSNFWRTLEIPFNNCEVNLILTWSASCFIVSTEVANQNGTFAITETKLNVPVVTLSTQDNAKLSPQSKSGFKRKINWNKYLSKPELLAQNPNLNYLVEPSFQGKIDFLFWHLKMIHTEQAVKDIISQM